MSQQESPHEDLAARIRSIVFSTMTPWAVPDDAADPLRERVIDSVGIIHLLAALEDHFHIAIPPAEIQPGNFQSLEALTGMMRRLIG